MTMEHKHDEKENLLFERVYVETPVDTDGDGKYDLIAVYIRRPASTLRGEKVPAIYVANPYMLSCNEDWYIPHDVNREVQVYPTQNITEEEIRYDFSQEPVYPGRGAARNPRIRGDICLGGGRGAGRHQPGLQLLQRQRVCLRLLRRSGHAGF